MMNRVKAIQDKAIQNFGFEDKRTIGIFNLLDFDEKWGLLDSAIEAIEKWIDEEINKPFDEE